MGARARLVEAAVLSDDPLEERRRGILHNLKGGLGRATSLRLRRVERVVALPNSPDPRKPDLEDLGSPLEKVSLGLRQPTSLRSPPSEHVGNLVASIQTRRRETLGPVPGSRVRFYLHDQPRKIIFATVVQETPNFGPENGVRGHTVATFISTSDTNTSPHEIAMCVDDRPRQGMPERKTERCELSLVYCRQNSEERPTRNGKRRTRSTSIKSGRGKSNNGPARRSKVWQLTLENRSVNENVAS
jgi:hypothetical protein